MLVPEVERMRALLVDAITTLCRSGLKYNEKLKVEGLIGITLDEAEIILVNLNRSFELAVSEKKPPSPSSSERESSPECEVIAESRTKSKRSKTASHNTYRESPSGKRSPENNLSGLQTPDDTPRKRLRRPRDRDNVRADDSPAKSLSRATGDQTLVSPNHNAGDKKSVNVCEISDSDNRVAPITSDAVNTPVVYQNRSSEVTDIVIHDVIEKEPETKTETSVSGQEPTGIHISTGYSYSDGQHALTTSEDTNRTSIVASSSRIDDPGHVTESMNPSTADRQSTSTQGESSGLNRGSTSEQAIIKIEIDSDCEADIKTLAEPNNTNHQESYQGELLSSALPAELAAMTHTNPPDMAGMYNPGQVAYGSPSVSAGVPSLNTPAQLYMTPDMSQGDPGVAPYQQICNTRGQASSTRFPANQGLASTNVVSSHPVQNQNTQGTADHSQPRTNTSKFCCKYCGKSFVSPTAIYDHEKRHEGRYRYKCGICGKGFMDRSWLGVHMNGHQNVKPYKCRVCNKGLASKYSKMKHEKKCVAPSTLSSNMPVSK